MTTTSQLIDEVIAELVQPEPDIVRVIGLLTIHRLTPEELIRSSNEQRRRVWFDPATPAFGRAIIRSEAEASVALDGETQSLPPMVPLKTKVSTLDVPCPACRAKAGKRCFRMTGRGPNAQPTDQPLLTAQGKPTNHKRRTARAQQVSS